MTLTGLVIIPLGLILAFGSWRALLALLVAMTLLQDAAVVVAGTFGLNPYFYVGMLVIGRMVLDIALFRRPLNTRVLRGTLPAWVLLLVSLLVFWLALVLFQGDILVMTGAAKFKVELATNFEPVRENMTQHVYLVLNILAMTAIAHFLARMEFRDACETIDRIVVWVIATAVILAFWDMANFYTGIPFPEAFLHSDAHAGAYDQTFGEIKRINGSFSEPSSMAAYVCACLLYAWKRLVHRLDGSSMALVMACLMSLALTTSTTAYVAIALFFLIVGRDMAIGATFGRRRRFRIGMGMLAALGVMAAGVAIGVAVAVANWHSIEYIYTMTVANKTHSTSFEERSAVDLMGIHAFIQTYFLGLGLGSHKPNNAIVTVLSNFGIAGVVVIGWFLWTLLRPIPPVPGMSAQEARGLTNPIRWHLIGTLLAHAVSGANLHTPTIWLFFALLIGLRASSHAAQPHRRRVPLAEAVAMPPVHSPPLGSAAG